MEYKTITLEITMDIPKTDCLAIDEIGDELAPTLEKYGTFSQISYYDKNRRSCTTCDRHLNEKGKESCDIAKHFGSDKFYCSLWKGK